MRVKMAPKKQPQAEATSAKKSKRPGSKKSKKEKDKTNELSSSIQENEPEHPAHILPLVLTSATQELFGCRADEDISGQNPYKLLRKDDIIQDTRNRAAVSDFSPVKQAVMDYPGDELLLVFDENFMYGQLFYLVISEEAKQSLLMPPAEEKERDKEQEDEEDEKEEEEEQTHPEPQPWVSLGSEREIEEESCTDTRKTLHCKLSRMLREFGAPVHFSDETPGVFTECTSSPDSSFSIRRMEQDCRTQFVPTTHNSSSQTTWNYQKTTWTQYEAQMLPTEEKENILQEENLKNFLSSSTSRVEKAIQQNSMKDMFVDGVCVLGEDGVYEEKVDTRLKVCQTFTELHLSKDKVISYISWHPAISGVIAVSVIECVSYEVRIDQSTKLLLRPPLIIFWSFSDPIKPQLLLECPDEVLCFEFCPSNPNVIAGGCMNGQVVLWDISGYVDRLQGTHKGVHKTTNNKTHFDPPVVRYCAMSGPENGHRGPLTDVQWLPHSFEVSRLGIPLENKANMSVQIVTCSPEGCVIFWDLRVPHVAIPSLTDKQPKAEVKPQENPDGVPNTFTHLNLNWKPLFRVTLPNLDGAGEYSPLKFSLRDGTCYTSAAAVDQMEGPAFSGLRMPSAKHMHHLDNISTKFYIGTEEGELLYTDWKLEKDNESGQLSSSKPSHVSQVHDSLINTVLHSPFFKDIVLTVGGWTFALWKEGVTKGPLVHSPSSSTKCTAGFWSLTRAAVFFIGKEDGKLEVWNLLVKTHEPVLVHNVSMAQISCIKPWIVSSRKHLLAVSDHTGMLRILELPWTLRHPIPNEEQSMSGYLNTQVERLSYSEKRSGVQSEFQFMPTVFIGVEDVMENMEEDQKEELLKEVQKDYEDYFILEKLLNKNLGLEKE